MFSGLSGKPKLQNPLAPYMLLVTLHARKAKIVLCGDDIFFQASD
jgi:hypothetical protein